jgi:hypothetical protein
MPVGEKAGHRQFDLFSLSEQLCTDASGDETESPVELGTVDCLQQCGVDLAPPNTNTDSCLIRLGDCDRTAL